MTRQDYINDYIDAYSGDHDEWLLEHKKYIEEGMAQLSEYFEADRFIEAYERVASKELLETLLVDAWYNNNYESGEFENHLARYMSAPIKNICTFRTEKFWDEVIKEKESELEY